MNQKTNYILVFDAGRIRKLLRLAPSCIKLSNKPIKEVCHDCRDHPVLFGHAVGDQGSPGRRLEYAR